MLLTFDFVLKWTPNLFNGVIRFCSSISRNNNLWEVLAKSGAGDRMASEWYWFPPALFLIPSNKAGLPTAPITNMAFSCLERVVAMAHRSSF